MGLKQMSLARSAHHVFAAQIRKALETDCCITHTAHSQHEGLPRKTLETIKKNEERKRRHDSRRSDGCCGVEVGVELINCNALILASRGDQTKTRAAAEVHALHGIRMEPENGQRLERSQLKTPTRWSHPAMANILKSGRLATHDTPSRGKPMVDATCRSHFAAEHSV